MEKLNIRSAFEELRPDDASDIELRTLIKGDTLFLIAELKAGKVLPAHYHHDGSEIYHVLSGTGQIETGSLSEKDVVWEKCVQILEDDVFEIKSGRVHRLSNTGLDSLRLVFIAPSSHLGDDRVFL